MHLTVRAVEGPGNQMLGAANSGYATLPRDGRVPPAAGTASSTSPRARSDLDLLAAHRRALATAFPGQAVPDGIRDPMPAREAGSGGGAAPRATPRPTSSS